MNCGSTMQAGTFRILYRVDPDAVVMSGGVRQENTAHAGDGH